MTKLHRSTSNRRAAGVCGGFAATYSWDPTLIRLTYILLGFLTLVLPFVVVYTIASIAIEKE